MKSHNCHNFTGIPGNCHRDHNLDVCPVIGFGFPSLSGIQFYYKKRNKKVIKIEKLLENMRWEQFKDAVENARKVQKSLCGEIQPQFCIHIYAPFNMKQIYSLKVCFIDLKTGEYSHPARNIMTGRRGKVPNLKSIFL